MPMEDIVAPKAPKDWRPTSDQQQRIQSDFRLQRMSRDDQYFYFNQKARDGVTVQRGSASTATPAQAAPPPPSGIFGWIKSVQDALAGR